MPITCNIYSELQKLHKQLVLGGFLTEAEFWATRKKFLDGDTSRVTRQLAGFKSAMLADVKPPADGRVQHRSLSRSLCVRLCTLMRVFICIIFACIGVESEHLDYKQSLIESIVYMMLYKSC
ncbi:hypothetical protein RHMOL_Rhmol06G0151300 [Rhododendron molle]|uniref:Uncharacterized protein n=1 Tax=Rhododendron molle TaxID=49168 RepID=A0ACC0NCN8_RHOML|nr:hypothetical protein RHMOL_Rhmol06G0151300 [Rhododendron molle]